MIAKGSGNARPQRPWPTGRVFPSPYQRGRSSLLWISRDMTIACIPANPKQSLPDKGTYSLSDKLLGETSIEPAAKPSHLGRLVPASLS